MVVWNLAYSKYALKDAKKISAAGLKDKTQALLEILKVIGFKNLVDVDVYFGPFTCVAGVNAVGKSNLFDAIHFLSALADHSLIDAALSVRNESGKTSKA